MPTALMQELLDNGEHEENEKAAKAAEKPPPPNVEAWSLGSVDLEDGDSYGGGLDDSQESQSGDEDDDLHNDPKIPKKTEIFEGKVIQVEKLVKQEEELMTQQ